MIITPYELNAKKHTKKQVEQVAASIKEFGMNQPIVVDKQGVIIVGHGRYEALHLLGWDIKDEYIKVIDISEEKAKAYRLADNKLNESDWDMNLVIEELKGLSEEMLTLTGFDSDLIIEADEKDDEVPETPEEPQSQLGDLYILGEHRLLCGSATDIKDVEKLMDGIYPDLIHTDPPYGMNAVTKSGVLKERYRTDILGDDNTNVAKDSFNLIYGLYPESKHIWWGANYYASALPDSECWLVWDKNNGESDQTDCELAWANFRSVVRQFTQASEKVGRTHPTQKPVSIMGWIIKRFNVTSKTIADYFGGSGSTLIAAEKAGIKSYNMELDPKYVDVIVQRYVDYTGNESIIKNGKTITWNKKK